MKLLCLSLFVLHSLSAYAAILSARPLQPSSGQCHDNNITYKGLWADGVEGFVGIRYAHDTGGQNRFKPPVPYIPAQNTSINAIHGGPGCPQSPSGPSTTAPSAFFFVEGMPTSISEDCLRLNVWRPSGTKEGDNLPVLVWIFGGGYTNGYKDDEVFRPGGMILQSVDNGHPIMHVELNYRLGIFGFAQSKALEAEGSENAGVRDQRLAIEWVNNNIAAFGGDPNKITIHGQSSGGESVGVQIMAFGATRPAPFQQAICESQALEPGITGNFTRQAMAAALAVTECNGTAFDSPVTVACLRNLSTDALLDAQVSTSESAATGNRWLPVVDGPGGFLPAAPSVLIEEGRFANVTTMMGWTETDGLFFTPDTSTAQETHDFIRSYLPGFTDTNIEKLLSLYPVSDFQASHFPNGTVQLTAEKYRSGRILQDILLTCQAVHYGQAIAQAGNPVYLYQQNQTILTPILEYYGYYGYGPVHTSEIAYVFGNLTHFHQFDYPYHPSASDFQLQDTESRTWSSFAALGKPSLPGHNTVQGWEQAQFADQNFGTYVIGGPNNGSSGAGGDAKAIAAMATKKLQMRCGFLNSPEIIQQQQY